MLEITKPIISKGPWHVNTIEKDNWWLSQMPFERYQRDGDLFDTDTTTRAEENARLASQAPMMLDALIKIAESTDLRKAQYHAITALKVSGCKIE